MGATQAEQGQPGNPSKCQNAVIRPIKRADPEAGRSQEKFKSQTRDHRLSATQTRSLKMKKKKIRSHDAMGPSKESR